MGTISLGASDFGSLVFCAFAITCCQAVVIFVVVSTFIYLYVRACIYVLGACIQHRAGVKLRGQRMGVGCLSAVWARGIELRPSGLPASTH